MSCSDWEYWGSVGADYTINTKVLDLQARGGGHLLENVATKWAPKAELSERPSDWGSAASQFLMFKTKILTYRTLITETTLSQYMELHKLDAYSSFTHTCLFYSY